MPALGGKRSAGDEGGRVQGRVRRTGDNQQPATAATMGGFQSRRLKSTPPGESQPGR